MITRAQIRRQLRSQGGIMNAVPRQGYFLGGIGRSIGKAVGKVGDVVGQITKSPIGKAALLAGTMYATRNMGPMGKAGGWKNFLMGAPDLGGVHNTATPNILRRMIGGIGLNKKTAIGAGALTLLGLSQEDQPNPEEVMSARRSGNIEEYLRRYYSNVNPGASDEEVDEFVRVNKASGGRIGFNTGTKKRKEKKSKGAHVKTVREILDEEYPTLFSDTTTSIEGSPGKKKYYKGKKDGGRIGYALGSLDPEDFPPKPIDDPLPFDLEQETGIPFSGQQVKELDAGADSIKKAGTHIAFYNTGNDRQNAWNVWDSKELSEQLEFDGFEDFFINGDWRDLIKGAAPVQGDMQMASSPDGELFMMEEFLQAVQEGFKGSYQDYLDQIDRIPSDYWGQAPSAEGIMQAAKGGRVKYGLGDLVGLRRKALSAMYNEENEEEYASGGRIRKYGGGILAATGLPGIPRMAPDGLEYDMRTGGFQPLGAKEGKDDVNAKLAKNEFVMTADAVRGAGGGDINKGAQRMYDTMKKLEGKIA